MAHDLVGDAGKELEIAGRHLDVGTGLAERLPVVLTLERGELFGAVADRRSNADHDPAALGRQHSAPRFRLERRVCRRHRAIDVSLGRFGHRRQALAG